MKINIDELSRVRISYLRHEAARPEFGNWQDAHGGRWA